MSTFRTKLLAVRTGREETVHDLTGVTKVRCGHYHSMALKSDGTVWAWGWNRYGQLGNSTNAGVDAANPQQPITKSFEMDVSCP